MNEKIGAAARIYLDSNIVIYFVERIPPWFDLVERVISAVGAGTGRLITSDLAAAECLLRPYKTGDAALVAVYERFFEGGFEVERVPLDYSLLKLASSLAGKFGMKLADAVHVATASAADCDLILTNDRTIRAPAGLNILMLSEIDRTS